MSAYYADETVTLWHGDSIKVLRTLPAGSVDSCVTSPPYFGLRDYGIEGQYGLEASPSEYVETMRTLFAEVRRVLADDGTLWLNIGDSYNAYNGNRGRSETGFSRNDPLPALPKGAGLTTPTLAPKNLLGMPWRVAFALQDDGWILRNAVIWNKPNAMPESVTDRLSTRYEHVFLFSKSRRYWFDLDPIRETLIYPDAADGSRVFGGVNKAADLNTGSSARRTGGTYGRTWEQRKAAGAAVERKLNPAAPGYSNFATPDKGRNPGDVWTIPTSPFPGSHFAVMPRELARRCIVSGCKPGGTVLDPFSGSGTTGAAATSLGRRYVGIDLSAEYLDLSLRTRLAQTALMDGDEAEHGTDDEAQQ